MPFAIALSGLNAASADLGVTANNVANVNTNRIQDVARTVRGSLRGRHAERQFQRVGQRCPLSTIAQQFTQGNIDFTDNALDLAIGGEGFLRAQRWRRTQLHASWRLRRGQPGLRGTNAQGSRLQAYPLRRQRPVQYRYAGGPAG